MAFRPLLFLIPVIALAQSAAPQGPVVANRTDAPGEVDQALRARVTEFFQDLVDHKYKDALDLVAEDTQNAYFASGKAPVKEFKISEVKYTDSLDKAVVTLQVKEIWKIQTEDVVADVPMRTVWKLDKGHWAYTSEFAEATWLTPMGPSAASSLAPPTRNADGTINIPRGITQKGVEQAAEQILQQTGVDKTEVTLAVGKAGSEKIRFHNGVTGSLSLEVYGPRVPGLKVKLDKSSVNAGEDAIVNLFYEPAEGSSARTVTLQLVAQPFNKVFPINLTLAEQAPQ